MYYSPAPYAQTYLKFAALWRSNCSRPVLLFSTMEKAVIFPDKVFLLEPQYVMLCGSCAQLFQALQCLMQIAGRALT